MTKVEEFITKVFTTLVNNFPSATILYEYKDISDTHFLKVTPISLYNSEEFVEFSSNLMDDFYNKDLEGMLCFLTEGALTELNQPTKKHLPENALIKTVEIFDETIVNSSQVSGWQRGILPS